MAYLAWACVVLGGFAIGAYLVTQGHPYFGGALIVAVCLSEVRPKSE